MSVRHITYAAAAVIAASLSACQSASPATSAPPTVAPETAAVTAAPTTAPTEAPASAQTPAAGQGLKCAFAGTGATMAMGDERLNFTCGEDSGATIGLFGEITLGDKGWEIAYAEIKPGSPPSNQSTVLVTHIILDDGTDCAFAGVGATTGIGDKRLNFTCGQSGDYTIGLFGDVTPGGKGWEITKGEVKIGPNGPESRNVTTALIAALVVE